LRRSYRAYGRVLASDLDFPELTPCDEPADITFHIDVLPQAPARWFDIWRFFEERPWVRASVCPDGYRIRYEEMADFFVNPARGVAIADPYACPPLTLRHFFLDQVLPLMLSVRDIVLHASAAAIDEKCVAFVGPGGSGKSTLALALGRLSFPVVSDDGLLVRQAGHDASSNGAQRPGLNWTAVPSYAGLRLWPDALEALAVGADARMVEHSPKGRLRDGVSFAAAAAPIRQCRVQRHVGARSARRDARPDVPSGSRQRLRAGPRAATRRRLRIERACMASRIPAQLVLLARCRVRGCRARALARDRFLPRCFRSPDPRHVNGSRLLSRGRFAHTSRRIIGRG
jgi:hypothetical protein